MPLSEDRIDVDQTTKQNKFKKPISAYALQIIGAIELLCGLIISVAWLVGLTKVDEDLLLLNSEIKITPMMSLMSVVTDIYFLVVVFVFFSGAAFTFGFASMVTNIAKQTWLAEKENKS